MRMMIVAVTLLMMLALAARAEDHQVIPVWPGQAPNETAAPNEGTDITTKNKAPVPLITDVTKPTLTVYPAPAATRTGTCVIIFPGGGYSVLAYVHEGTEVAEFLNKAGVTGIVLKYRVPARPGQTPRLPALQDAQRAVSLVRSKAAELGIDPNRIGVLGFSAGGHLTVKVATSYNQRSYEPIDNVDKVSCRPDFAVPVYPAYIFEKGHLAPDIKVDKNTPPMFLAHAGNDPYSAEGSIALFLALKHAGVPAELHVFGDGGHGFGMRAKAGSAPAQWPHELQVWMHSRGLLDKAK